MATDVTNGYMEHPQDFKFEVIIITDNNTSADGKDKFLTVWPDCLTLLAIKIK